MNEIRKCDECGKPTTEIHQAADNNKEGEHFVYICKSCWDKRLEDAINIWSSTPNDHKRHSSHLSNFGIMVPQGTIGNEDEVDITDIMYGNFFIVGNTILSVKSFEFDDAKGWRILMADKMLVPTGVYFDRPVVWCGIRDLKKILVTPEILTEYLFKEVEPDNGFRYFERGQFRIQLDEKNNVSNIVFYGNLVWAYMRKLSLDEFQNIYKILSQKELSKVKPPSYEGWENKTT